MTSPDEAKPRKDPFISRLKNRIAQIEERIEVITGKRFEALSDQEKTARYAVFLRVHRKLALEEEFGPGTIPADAP